MRFAVETGIRGKVAVITGAANGIGAAIAEQLAREGATVTLLDRDAERLDALETRLRGHGMDIARFALDLTDREAVKSAFASIRIDRGPVDILVNNVGQAPRERVQEFSETDPALWDFIFDVSLMTTLHCSQQVVSSMREKRSGRIVNLSSEAPFTGGVKSPEYTAAKAGVIGFTRGLARELAPYSVTVNSVGPGATMTAAMKSFPKEQLALIRQTIPMGRLAAPADIADAVVFLASERAGFITGQTLLVNGGSVFH